MASDHRQATADLSDRHIESSLKTDDFFQLVRTFECFSAQHMESSHGSFPLGADAMPHEEPVRFRSANHQAFAPTAVSSVKPRSVGDGSGPQYEMDVNFMGLTGSTGILPNHYTRMIVERLKRRDTSLADFLDLFNHRLISLFYRGYTKYKVGIQMESHRARGRCDPFTRVLQSLAGRAQGDRNQTQLYFSGHFSRRVRSASALRSMLSEILSCPVDMDSNVGRWLAIREEDAARIGTGQRGNNHLLGSGVMVGRRAWDGQSTVRLRIGPVSHQQYRQMMSGTARYARMRHLVCAYLPPHIAVELKFLIRDSATARERLGGRLQLGVNTWLSTGGLTEREARVKLRRWTDAGAKRPSPTE